MNHCHKNTCLLKSLIAAAAVVLIAFLVMEPKDEMHEMKDHAEHQHDHIMLTGPADSIPSIELTAHKDPKSGWNLQVVTENYRFAPEHASTDHVDGEGHSHLYVDGKKITRLYGEWYYLGSLEPGTHTVRVDLTSNNHSTLMYDGKEIADEVVITAE